MNTFAVSSLGSDVDIDSFPSGRRIVVMAVMAGVLLATAGLLGYSLLRESRDRQQQVTQTVDLQQQLGKLDNSLHNAGRSVLFPLASGAQVNSVVWLRLRSLVESDLERLRAQADDEPLQQDKVRQLGRELEAHLSAMGALASSDRRGDPALPTLLEERRQHVMKIEAAMADLGRLEAELLHERELAFTASSNRQGVVLGVTALLGLSFLAIAAAMLVRQSRQLARARKALLQSTEALQSSNARLEERVRQRTETLQLSAAAQKLRNDASQLLIQNLDVEDDARTLESWRECLLNAGLVDQVSVCLAGREPMGAVEPAATSEPERVVTVRLPLNLGAVTYRRVTIPSNPESARARAQDVVTDLGAWLELRRQRQVRRDAERERDERGVLLDALFEQVPFALAVLDTQLRFVRINAAAAMVVGSNPQQALGRTAEELRRRPGPPVLLPLFDEVRDTGMRVVNRKISLLPLPGVEVSSHLLVSVLPLLGTDGKPFGQAVTALDITELEETRQRLGELARQLMQVKENERSTLARELHDDFGQRLAALKMDLQLLHRQIDDSKPQPLLEDALNIVESCIAQVRERAFNLRPPQLDELGLAAALRAHAQEQAMRSGVKITVDADLRDLTPSNAWSSHLFRIAQEGLRNALQHGRPRKVGISVVTSQAEVVLTISDDGDGLPQPRARRGLGLLNMQERSELLGGTFSIGPGEPRGTELRCRWPRAVVDGRTLLQEMPT